MSNKLQFVAGFHQSHTAENRDKLKFVGPHSPFPIPHSPLPTPHSPFLSNTFCALLQERRQGSKLAADLLAVSHDRLDTSARIFRDVIIDLRGAGLEQQNQGRAAEFEI